MGALFQRESNSNQPAPVRRWRLKRAILPAAISETAAIRLLAEAESREPPGAGPASPSGLREMIARNRTRLTLSSFNLSTQGDIRFRVPPAYGALSSAGQSACLWNKRSRVRTP